MISIVIIKKDAIKAVKPNSYYARIYEDVDGQLFAKLHKRFAKRAIDFFGGRNRNVFVMPGNYVVKIPTNFDGLSDNEWEGSVSNTEESYNDPDYVQYPKTRLAYFKGLPIVFMELIQPLTGTEIRERFGSEPDWVMSVDCGQVGINKNGRLVAYDYGVK